MTQRVYVRNLGGTPIVIDAALASDLNGGGGIETPDWVNVMDYGAIADGSTHLLSSVYANLAAAQAVYPFVDDLFAQVDWCAIQSAIDDAFDQRIRITYMPSGTYVTNYPIFLDAPDNLRGTAATWSAVTNYGSGDIVKWNGVPWQSQQAANLNNVPRSGVNDAWWLPYWDTETEFTFSMALHGDSGTSLGNPGTHVRGTVIDPLFRNFVVLWSGPGQHMEVDGITISGPSAQTPQLSTNAAGFSVAGGNGGASHSVFRGCTVTGGYLRGFVTGLNNGNLGDSNIFERCDVSYCYKGWDFTQTQNYINALVDCRTTFCKISVASNVSKAVQIRGGNFSAASMASATLSIASIVVDGDAGPNLTTEVHVVLNATHANLTNGKFDTFVIDTEHFGPVPLEKVSWTAGTLTLELTVLNTYARQLKRDTGNPTTEFDAQLTAATTVYACEQAIVFQGSGFHVRGLHIENPNTVTCLYDDLTGFSGDQSNSFEDIFFNWDPTLYDLVGSSLERYLCQVANPFIKLMQGVAGTKVVFKNCSLEGTIDTLVGVIIESDGGPNQSTITRTEGAQAGGGQIANQITDGGHGFQTPARGAGKWTGGWQPYFIPFQADRSKGFVDARYRAGGEGNVPHWGFRPAPYAQPKLTPAMVEQLAASPLGSIVYDTSDSTENTGAPYPLLHGETTYSVSEWDQTSSALRYVRSRHKFYSYGQDLDIDWEYRAKSTIVHVSDVSKLFAGLGIILDNGVSGDVEYVIVGVYRRYTGVVFDSLRGGYVIVCKASDDKDNGTAGTGNTVYTGATIKQSPYLLTFSTGEFRSTKTSNYTVLIRDVGTQFDNAGASGTVVFSLPVVTAAIVGLRYSFAILAAQTLTVDAPASTTIRIAGSVSAASGNISNNTVGNYVEIEAVSTTSWVAKSHEGTWTVT